MILLLLTSAMFAIHKSTF